MRNWREEIRRDIHEKMTTSQMYQQDPETATQDITLQTIADITKDGGDDGRDMSGIFDEFGNSMFVDPPGLSDPNVFNNFGSNSEAYGNRYVHKFNWTNTDVVPTEVNPERSDSSKNPGPLCYYYNATDDRTYIGFLRQSDRGFTQIARFDGDWDDWDESSNSGTNFNRGVTGIQAAIDGDYVSWLKNQTTSGNVADFRAFVDDSDMTDTDGHGRINIKMVNTIKAENTNLWSVYSANDPITSDQKVTLQFHFRTNSYYNYRGNDAVDSNPSSVNTGSTKARRAKTPAVAPVFYDSDAESPVYYNSQNGRVITDAVKDLIDTVEFTVPSGGQLDAQGNAIGGKFNINGIGLKWRYITAAENPDTAHPEPDQDQNGYNHTRNFPDVPFDDYLIWTISINGQDYQLRNGIEGLTCAIGIPGYTKEKWVQGPVNSAKGLPAFTNSYNNKKPIGNVNDMNLEGINQIMNLAKTTLQVKKKKGQKFIQQQQIKQTEIKQNRIQTQSLKRIDSIIKSNNSNLKKLTKGLSDSVKSDLGLDDTPKPSNIPNFTPPSADPANGNTPPKPPSGASMGGQLGLPKTEPLTPPDSKPPEGKGEPTPPDDEKLPVRPKFVDRYKQNREMTRQTNERQRKSYERTWPTISDKDIQQWKSWAAREKVSVGTVYDRAVQRYYMGYEKYTYANVINPQLRYDVRALTDYYNIDSLKPQRTSPPQVWEWRIDDLERLIKAMVKNHQNEFKYLGMPADWYQMTSTSHMDFLKGKQEANVRWWEPKIKSRMDELERMKEEYAELFGGPPPDSAMGDGDSSGPGEGDGDAEGGLSGQGAGGPEGKGEGGPSGLAAAGRGLRSATDQARFGGDQMFQGNPKGRTPGLSNYWSPEPKTAAAYSRSGPTKGLPGARPDPSGTLSTANRPANVKVSRGLTGTPQFKLPKGTTPTNILTSVADDAAVSAGRKAAATGAGRLLGRAVPVLSAGLAAADAAQRASRGDNFGAALSAASAIPGPIGWGALGVQVATDAAGVTGGVKEEKEFSSYKDYIKNARSIAKKKGIKMDRDALIVSFLDTVAKSDKLDDYDKQFFAAIITGAKGIRKKDVIDWTKNLQKKLNNGINESLEKWEKKLIKEDIDLPKKNFFEIDRSDIWRKQDKTKNMIASREKGMRVDQRMAYSRFFTADSQNKLDKTLNSVKQQFNYQGKPSPNGFPDQPPKEIGKDGFTKDYGQRDAYYNKLDPISANTMQHVGNHDPNMQKKVDSVRQDSRLKQRDKILSNFKKVVDRA